MVWWWYGACWAEKIDLQSLGFLLPAKVVKLCKMIPGWHADCYRYVARCVALRDFGMIMYDLVYVL
jgi:hypothetical protein